jgi:hypothetical protein
VVDHSREQSFPQPEAFYCQEALQRTMSAIVRLPRQVLRAGNPLGEQLARLPNQMEAGAQQHSSAKPRKLVEHREAPRTYREMRSTPRSSVGRRFGTGACRSTPA